MTSKMTKILPPNAATFLIYIKAILSWLIEISRLPSNSQLSNMIRNCCHYIFKRNLQIFFSSLTPFSGVQNNPVFCLLFYWFCFLLLFFLHAFIASYVYNQHGESSFNCHRLARASPLTSRHIKVIREIRAQVHAFNQVLLKSLSD